MRGDERLDGGLGRQSAGVGHERTRSTRRRGRRGRHRLDQPCGSATGCHTAVALHERREPAGMLRRVMLIVLVPLLLAACGSSALTPTGGRASSPSPAPPGGATPSGAGDPAAIGAAFIGALSRGDDAAAEGMEDATMRAAAPGPALGQIWAQFVAQYGAFQAIGTVTTTTQAPYTIAAVATQFANSAVTLTVAISSAGQVSGLHVAKVAPASSSPGSPSSPSSSPAAYVNRAAFTETAVTVGSSPWALPGTLSLPNGSGPSRRSCSSRDPGRATGTRRSGRTSPSATSPGASPRPASPCSDTTSVPSSTEPRWRPTRASRCARRPLTTRSPRSACFAERPT